MILYCPDKGQNIIDKTKFHDNIIMKYCPGGHNFIGHNFALHMQAGNPLLPTKGGYCHIKHKR